MNYKSATDPVFLETVKAWLESRGEILVLIRYSHATGSRDFEFFTSFDAFSQAVAELPPLACITVFGQPQLPLRGIVDHAFIAECLEAIPENAEHLVVELQPRTYEDTTWFHHGCGSSHYELVTELEEVQGFPVAVGLYPPWQEDSPDVLSALVPDKQGQVRLGAY